jgi:hypothetical protein
LPRHLFCLAVRKDQRVARMSGAGTSCSGPRDGSAEPNQPGKGVT